MKAIVPSAEADGKRRRTDPPQEGQMDIITDVPQCNDSPDLDSDREYSSVGSRRSRCCSICLEPGHDKRFHNVPPAQSSDWETILKLKDEILELKEAKIRDQATIIALQAETIEHLKMVTKLRSELTCNHRASSSPSAPSCCCSSFCLPGFLLSCCCF